MIEAKMIQDQKTVKIRDTLLTPILIVDFSVIVYKSNLNNGNSLSKVGDHIAIPKSLTIETVKIF